MNVLANTPAPVVLNTGQQAGADAFFRYLHSDETIFVLSGNAGVGKTFLMGHLCDTVLDDYKDACRLLGTEIRYTKVNFTATTNKAAEVLEKAIGKPVKTIHSFLGLKVVEDYNTGKTRLQKTKNWHVRKNEIIFVDEASTIDTQLFKILIESCPYCKIIFVGDHSQMAPVNEPVSPCFDAVTQDCFVFLDQPVRNAESPALMNLCAQLRETVATGQFQPMYPVPGVIEYLDDTEMQAKLYEKFQDMDPSCRVLCYSNERVQQFNEHIRQNVRKMPAQIQVGDVLVVGQTGQSTTGTILNVERDVLVLSAGPTHQAGHVDPSIFSDGKPLRYNELRIKMLNTGMEHTVRLPQELDRFAAGLKHFARRKRWAEYFDLKNNFVDLRDKAACTVYKAQGSTYDEVFVDIGNIGTCFKADVVARMLFVAVSRARSRVYFFGQLPGRYVNTRPN